MTVKPSKISFGIGGFGSRERRFVAEVVSYPELVNNLGENLRAAGFWTVITKEVRDRPGISIGEVITQ